MVEAAPKDMVGLSIGGQRYEGWTSVSITRGIEAMTGEFTLALAARDGEIMADFPFRAGVECKVMVDDELLISGYVDAFSPSFDDQSHHIQLSGRDRAGDLVDCSAINVPGSWANVSLETIANDIVGPFGVQVTAKASTAPVVKRFALQQGESAHAAIERLASYRALLVVSAADGNLELISPATGAGEVKIVQGEHIKSAEASHDVRERFSLYLVKGQASGDDQASGKAVAGQKGMATDPAITRYRPKLIIAEEQSTIDSLTTRAKWEATIARAKGQKASVTVQGWRRSDGQLWTPNRVIDLAAPWLAIEAPMLLSEVTLTLDERGRTASLGLTPPEAFTQRAVPEDGEAGRITRKAA